MLRVGLIGFGAIGQDIAHLVKERASADMMLVGALVRHPTRPRPAGSPKIVATCSALVAEQPDVVVEVAGHEGLREHASALLRAGIDLLLVSSGALAEPEVLDELLVAAQAGSAQARVVSGGIGALDALAAASLGGSIQVIHTLRKPPQTLLTSEEAVRLTTACEVFRGSARQAAMHFPEFLNVAAAVALATNSFDQSEVLVIADPAVRHSLHEVQAEGAFGRLRFEIEHTPISGVGRGARLVAMSVVHSLLSRRAPFVIG